MATVKPRSPSFTDHYQILIVPTHELQNFVHTAVTTRKGENYRKTNDTDTIWEFLTDTFRINIFLPDTVHQVTFPHYIAKKWQH